MRHRKAVGKLGRTSAHRRAMFRNMVTDLLESERVRTTDAKAKELRRIAERMITLGKRGDLHARRRALRVVRTKAVAAKLFSDLATRFRDRPGGYTRVVKLGPRRGDFAPLSIVELVEGDETQKTSGRGRRPAAPGGTQEGKKARTRRIRKSEEPARKSAKPRASASRARAKSGGGERSKPTKKS